MHGLVKWMMWLGLILLALGIWKQDDLPDRVGYDPVLLQEPEQTAISRAAFTETVGGITYTIQPKFDYVLNGLVVSLHDAGSWKDYLHEKWNDNLNVLDLCVIWGRNVSESAWRNIEFSSGQFTCNFFTRSSEAYHKFNQAQISNNHLLTANPDLARRLRDVRIGDQIRLRGYLAEYSHHHGFAFKRGTSTVRTDTGNGACETLYVEDLQVLRRGLSLWGWLKWLGAVLLATGLLGWISLPMRVR